MGLFSQIEPHELNRTMRTGRMPLSRSGVGRPWRTRVPRPSRKEGPPSFRCTAEGATQRRRGEHCVCDGDVACNGVVLAMLFSAVLLRLHTMASQRTPLLAVLLLAARLSFLLHPIRIAGFRSRGAQCKRGQEHCSNHQTSRFPKACPWEDLM